MRIVVAGCGKIGVSVIASLAAEGHDVVAVDSDDAVVDEINNIYDVIGVIGNSVDCDVLSEAGVSRAEMFIATTGSDELNMLSCFLAKKMGAKHTVARIRNPEYNEKSLGFMRHELGLSLAINPERLAAQELFNVLKLPYAAKIETFSRGNFEMVEIKLKKDSPLCGKNLAELRGRYKSQFIICTVQRGKDVYIPDGNFTLAEGDKVGITASPVEIGRFFKELGIMQKQAKNIILLGGSRIAYYLAKMLTSSGSCVKIIEQDKVLCDEICEGVPKALVINADGAQQEVLMEEGLKNCDAFVTLTGNDESNILLSIFAASQNVPKVIAKISRTELEGMAENLGLDCIVSPRKTVADIIVRYARALKNSLGSKVETLYKLSDGAAEALEFTVGQDFRSGGIPLKDLHLKSNILIAGIIRGRKPIVPAGDDVILPGDSVVVISAKHRLDDLSDIMK